MNVLCWSKLDLAFSECFATRGDPGFLKNNICCFFFITLLLTQACFNQQGEDIQSSGKCINHKAIPVGIGEDTQIKKAVIDKNARIGKNVLVLWKIHQSSSIRSSKTYVHLCCQLQLLQNLVISAVCTFYFQC